MPLSRLSALVPSAVGNYLATTFSVHHHPTVVRYRGILAQAFYHHGRLCASNQATVMVLVILFVGMISYPALVTYYNLYILSPYRHHPTASTNSHLGGLGTEGPASLRRSDLESGNLDEFWSGIIEPTWSQDPAMFQKTLPNKPLHYLAPVIINATDTFVKYENGAGPGILSDAEVLVYAADVQRRLQSITVDLTEDMLMSRQTPSSSSSSSSTTSDPMDVWETPLEDGLEEDVDDNEVETNEEKEEEGAKHSQQQQDGSHSGDNGQSEQKTKSSHRRRRQRRKVSLRDICVLDPQSLHHPPADRGYTRIWPEKDQEQHRATARAEDSLMAIPLPSPNVDTWKANRDNPERGRNIVHLSEDQSGTSFGNNHLLETTTFTDQPTTTHPSASPSSIQSNPSEHAIPSSSAEQPQPQPRLFECLIQSPVAYWQNDVERIRADKDILGTISSRQNSTLPLSQSTLFGGRVLNQQTNQVQGATSVIMTFFLRGNAAEMYPEEYRRIYGKHVDDSHDGNEHNGNDKAWRKDLDVVKVWTALFNAVMRDLRHEREAAWLKAQPQQQQPISQDEASQKFHQQQQLQPGAVLPPKSPNPMSEPMQAHTYAPTPSVVMTKISQDVELGHGGFKRLISGDFAKPKTNISAEYWLLAMAYFVMFLYISLSVGRVDLVKSKYGLGIAAVATVFVSLVMSIGICSVFGVTLTLMPWEILPFMIIVVGVENINILVHAVVETSMDLPVKERVGRGLGAVGVSITMTLLAELCLLIVGAMTTIPAVQEFCTFAIAAVIMDYLLQMTFFITVISIDIRRLELTDLSATGHRHRGVSFKYPYGNRHHHHHHLSHHSNLLQYGPYSAATRGGSSTESEAAASHHPFIKHSRSGSHASTDGDDDDKGHGKAANKNPKGRIFTSIVMVGVMAYLGYIYGTTNQTLENEEAKKAQVSYWHIASPDVSSAFWKLVDPDAKGGYLEICPPVVLTMATPSYSANGSECVVLPQGDDSDCETTEGSEDEEGVRRGGEPDDITRLGRQQQQQQQQAKRGGHKGALDDKGKPKGKRKGKKGKNNKNDKIVNDGTLDPRRPFKLLKQVIIFAFFFAFWLLRVFVIPSMILAAAILVLLSYLLSPQRKLLVDLQWRFPFIVLPGDYQSKRQLMMEQLLAQEARELGLDGSASSFAPLPGTVETFKRGGHVTDIEQMDVNPAGLILSSSMDKKILLWHGGSGHSTDDVGTQAENRLPLARLLSTTGAISAATPGSVAQPYSFPGMAMMAATGETMKRVVRCLKLDPLGRYAAAGYTDGGVHLWEIDKVIQDLPSTPISPRQQQQQGRAPGVVPDLKATLELHRHYQQTDMPSRSQESTNNAIRARVTTLQFWNDVEEEEDDDEEDYFGSARYRSAVPPPPSSLFVGYRDGQVCEWCPESGKLRTSFQTKHRGGVAELALVRLTSKTRKDLGLSQDKTYLVTGGKDGSLQCWVRFGRPLVTHYHHNQQQHRQQSALDDEDQESWQWSRIWAQPGDGSSSSSIVVLSVDKEVPMVATGTANGAIKVWDLEQGNLIWTLSRGAVSAMPTAPTATTTTAAAASALYMTGRAGVQSSPAELHHSRKQSLGSAFENHQPSHQAAVTRIIFKPLELEDGVTGEPAPRVWLIISSGMDEVVMVWMVEWEGLLSMKPAGGGSSGSTGAPSTSSTLATPPPFLRTGQRSNSQLNLHHHLGPLSTSLPAPRLVGYMKQRGGKSIAVRHTSVFGVRRKENAALSTNSGSSSGGSILSARKHSYASVVDAAGLSQPGTTGYSATVPSSSGGNLLRHRSKSDSGSHQALTAAAAAAAAAGNNSTKRGWEVWEADLYQCIFKDPGVWGLELEVRTIDLQPTVPAQPSHGSNNSLANNNINAGIQTGGLTIPSSPASGRTGSGLGVDMPMVTTNGSSAAVMVGYDPSGATPPTPKAKLRRRPGSAATNNNSGSHHNNIPTQGYVYSMADSPPSTQHHHHLHPLTATRHPEAPPSGSPSPLDPWMVEPAMMLMEEPEPDLLPFVETRHIFAVDYIPWMAATKASTALDDHQPLHLTSPLRPPLGRWPSEQNIQTTTATTTTAQAPPNEMGGIIVGFGNWIKVVRLEDEEEDEEVEEDEEDPDGYNERSF